LHRLRHPRQRYEIIVPRVSKQRLDLPWVLAIDSRFLDGRHNLRQIIRIKAFPEIFVGQGVPELAHEPGTNDGLEIEVEEGRQDQPGTPPPGRLATPETSVLASTTRRFNRTLGVRAGLHARL
jgi:hypothetical protein